MEDEFSLDTGIYTLPSLAGPPGLLWDGLYYSVATHENLDLHFWGKSQLPVLNTD